MYRAHRSQVADFVNIKNYRPASRYDGRQLETLKALGGSA